jgi:antitoxin CptB
MTVEPSPAPAVSEARLRWLCRRGMKELDVVVTRFLDRHYASAPPQRQTAFVRLLSEVEDPDMWSWVMGYSTPADEFADVIEQLRRHD